MLPWDGCRVQKILGLGGNVEKGSREVKCFQEAWHLSHNVAKGLSFVQRNQHRLKSRTCLGKRGPCSGATGLSTICTPKEMWLECTRIQDGGHWRSYHSWGPERAGTLSPSSLRAPASSANSSCRTGSRAGCQFPPAPLSSTHFSLSLAMPASPGGNNFLSFNCLVKKIKANSHFRSSEH